MDFTKLTGEALTAALDLNVTTASDAALAAALVPRTEALATLLAIEPAEATAAQADLAEALTASKGVIEAEVAKRAEAKKATADKFAAAKAKFASDEEMKKKEEAEMSVEDEYSADAEVEASDEGTEEDAEADAEETDEDAEEADAEGEADGGEGEATPVAATKRAATTTKPRGGRATAAAVARANKRPALRSSDPVTITASSNVEGFSLGQKMEGMDAVGKAMQNVVKAFPKFNARSAQAVNEQTGGMPQVTKHGVAQFQVDFPEALVADGGNAGSEYRTAQNAIKDHVERLNAMASGNPEAALTAAGWCAPSPYVYSWVADYVVDGLLTLPEVSAPRGGLQITTGPRVGGESQGSTNLNNHGWIQTEAQAEAQTVKPFEVIECPEFIDYRLDAIGHAYKIPILTQKAYPELITDTLRFADVMYAHKVNAYLINDLVTLAGTAKTFAGYGPSLTDTLEALSILAVKERRKWSIGENAMMEVKMPVWAKEVFRADMSRRNNAPLDDPINDMRLAAHFASRRLAVEWISDFEELTGDAIVLPASFSALIYPAGAVVKAVEDVVNLSAIYDAASLSINEYVGVFFEQGIMTAPVAYSVSKVTIPVNTAGEAGALSLTGLGDAVAAGSF